MKGLFCFAVIGLSTTTFPNHANDAINSLVNCKYIREYLTHEAAWADSHAAEDDNLGAGMLYYALAYMQKATFCVCLGSGGGFVPRMMRQAQRDLKLENARTLLVDGNKGDFGRPQWLSEEHFFKQAFPDIEIWIQDTYEASLLLQKGQIDYLHIDADHSFEGVCRDFLNFLPLMKRGGVITFHDTGGGLPCAQIVPFLKKQGYEIINFPELGAGVAILSVR